MNYLMTWLIKCNIANKYIVIRALYERGRHRNTIAINGFSTFFKTLTYFLHFSLYLIDKLLVIV